MSSKKYFATFALVAGISVVFGMLLASGPFHRASDSQPAVWAPAVAATTAAPAIDLSGGVVAPSFADVAEQANPAVVSVTNVELKKVSRDPHRDSDSPFDDPFRFFFGPRDQNPHGRAPGDREPEGEQDEQRQESGGSGFIISDDGYILTNNHVVENATKLTVGLVSGETYEAKLIGKDAAIDLALLKIEAPRKLPVIPMGDSDALRVGEWVIAIGNPLTYEHTVTVGVVSGKGRQIQDGSRNETSFANFIQTDAAINFGNSGGPLLNGKGQVIGINTAITRNYGPYQGMIEGIGFALPINQAKAVIDQLKDTGRVARGYLGIQISPVKEKEQHAFNLPSASGALVQKVEPGLPGAAAGLRPGDVIVSINGSPIKDTVELIRVVSSKRPGETVNLGVIRDGEQKTLKVNLTDREKGIQSASNSVEENDEQGNDEESVTTSAARLGITVTEITPEIEREAELPSKHPDGVIVANVKQSSAAFEEGLRQGFIITKVNNVSISSVRDFKSAVDKIKPGDYVKLYTTFYTSQGEGARFIVFQADK